MRFVRVSGAATTIVDGAPISPLETWFASTIPKSEGREIPVQEQLLRTGSRIGLRLLGAVAWEVVVVVGATPFVDTCAETLGGNAGFSLEGQSIEKKEMRGV